MFTDAEGGGDLRYTTMKLALRYIMRNTVSTAVQLANFFRYESIVV